MGASLIKRCAYPKSSVPSFDNLYWPPTDSHRRLLSGSRAVRSVSLTGVWSNAKPILIDQASSYRWTAPTPTRQVFLKFSGVGGLSGPPLSRLIASSLIFDQPVRVTSASKVQPGLRRCCTAIDSESGTLMSVFTFALGKGLFKENVAVPVRWYLIDDR